MITVELGMQNHVTDTIAPALIGTATAGGRKFNRLE